MLTDFPFFKVILWISSEVFPLVPSPLKNLPFLPASSVALLPKMVITLPLKSISLVYAPILNAGLKVMLTLGAAHAVTSCAQEVTGGGEGLGAGGGGGANTHLQGGKLPGPRDLN